MLDGTFVNYIYVLKQAQITYLGSARMYEFWLAYI